MKKLLVVLALLAVVIAVAASLAFLRPGYFAQREVAQSKTIVVTQKLFWTCGMHPQVIQDHPGDCPICHMQLTPVKASGAATARGSGGSEVIIDPVIVQNMGVRTAEVVQGPLRMTVRTVGYLSEAEPNVHDVNLRVS